jgi:hypothetical protein
LQLDQRVVGEDRRTAQNMTTDRLRQRFQQRRRLADPAGQDRAVQIDAFALEDLALPVERQVIAVLGDQHTGEQAGTRAPPLDRARRQGRLADGLAAGAGQARPHDPVHHEPTRHVVQLFGDILAQRLEPTAARATSLAGREDGLLARQVRRQRLALGLALRRGGGIRRRHGLVGLSRRDLLVLQPELELVEALGGRAEPMPAKAGQLMLELGDPQRLGLHQRDQALGGLAQFGRIFGQRLGFVEHDHC